MLEIEARDKGNPSKKSTVPIKIIITQTVNAYPQWLADYSATPIPLPENVPVNYVVKRLKAVSTVRDATVSSSCCFDIFIIVWDELGRASLKSFCSLRKH